MGSEKISCSFQDFKWLAKQPRLFLLQCPSPSFPELKVLFLKLAAWEDRNLVTGFADTGRLQKPSLHNPCPGVRGNKPRLTTSAIKGKINNAQRHHLESTELTLQYHWVLSSFHSNFYSLALQFYISKSYSVTSSQSSCTWSGDSNQIYFLPSSSQVIQDIHIHIYILALLTSSSLGHVVPHPPPCSDNSCTLQLSKAVSIIGFSDRRYLSSIMCVELLVSQLSLYLAESSLPPQQCVICSLAE